VKLPLAFGMLLSIPMLTKSERVKLMQEVTARLSSEPWDDVALTFRQFGCKQYDLSDFDGDPVAYVRYTVENESEEMQLELAEHLGVTVPARAATKLPDCWNPPGYLRCFISHISAEKGKAAALQIGLTKYGIVGFVAHNDIKPTKAWQVEIERALSTADALGRAESSAARHGDAAQLASDGGALSGWRSGDGSPREPRRAGTVQQRTTMFSRPGMPRLACVAH
jgi:hypothetical protein